MELYKLFEEGKVPMKFDLVAREEKDEYKHVKEKLMIIMGEPIDALLTEINYEAIGMAMNSESNVKNSHSFMKPALSPEFTEPYLCNQEENMLRRHIFFDLGLQLIQYCKDGSRFADKSKKKYNI